MPASAATAPGKKTHLYVFQNPSAVLKLPKGAMASAQPASNARKIERWQDKSADGQRLSCNTLKRARTTGILSHCRLLLKPERPATVQVKRASHGGYCLQGECVCGFLPLEWLEVFFFFFCRFVFCRSWSLQRALRHMSK